MNDEGNLRDRLQEIKSIIHEEKLLFILFTLILPGGLILLVFLKEFSDYSSGFIFIFFLTTFLLFLLIYWIFLRLKKGLKLKILGKVEYFLYDSNFENVFEDFKKYCSEFSQHFKNKKFSHKETKIKTFNKWIEDSDKWTEDTLKRFADRFDSYESEYDKIISDLGTLKVKAAQEIEKNTTISSKNFVLIIFASFIISLFMYYIFEFVRTMNGFRIVYVSFFIILLLIDYLKEVLNIIRLSFGILFYRLVVPISKRYLNWQIKKFSQESIK